MASNNSLEHTSEHISPNEYLFQSLVSDDSQTIQVEELLTALTDAGLQQDDPRFSALYKQAKKHLNKPINYDQFCKLIEKNITFVEKALTGGLIIPDFIDFKNTVENIYQRAKKNETGELATYIPELAQVDPAKFGMAVCTVDGQRFSFGDAEDLFCAQSTCKPINYCLALEEFGEQQVHRHVGREPSGDNFNAVVFNKKGLPHNPMINAGAIVCCSMIKPQLSNDKRIKHVLDIWRDLSGGSLVDLNRSVYQSEKETSDRNFAIGYFMREKNIFPKDTDLLKTLDFYFQCCSVDVSCQSMAVISATLANGGLNPLTGKKIFQANTVKNCLSMMSSCGMYDFSGEFLFTVGIPSKSGVSGAIMIVIPNTMGICVWSPKIDPLGNSARGIEFCQQLVQKYNFHSHDSLLRKQKKKDPRLHKPESQLDSIIGACWAASLGDLYEIKRLVAAGIDMNQADYDGRTVLHLAATEGREKVLNFLVKLDINLNPVDRWGNTPLDDAYLGSHSESIKILESHGAKNRSVSKN